MKLYATTTSERASKGQGGNKFICINLLNEKKEIVTEINYMPSSVTVRHFDTTVHFDAVSKANNQKDEILPRSQQ